jgi:Tol biopolymer transport system component
VKGGQPRILTAALANGGFPSFSRDGRWIYLTFVRNGPGRIWKVPASGGEAVPVTPNAGTLAIESPDGRHLYYIARAEGPSSLWRLRLAGGEPVKVLDGVMLGAFDVIERGIYYVESISPQPGRFTMDRPGDTRLQFFDFATARSTTVAANLGRLGFGLSASLDGRSVFFSRFDSSIHELTMVDGFQ